MKHLSLLFLFSLVSVVPLQAMHKGHVPQKSSKLNFVPGPAAILKKIQDTRRCTPNFLGLGLNVAFMAGLRGFFGMHYGQGVVKNPLIEHGMLVYNALQYSQRLTVKQIKDETLQATSLNSSLLRFASCLSQQIVYQQVICPLVQKLELCKQLQGKMNLACDYHWAVMIGATIVEQLALMTAHNICQEYLLKPIFDWIFGKCDLPYNPSVIEWQQRWNQIREIKNSVPTIDE